MADYIEFFGFNDNPFRITPDIDFFFMSSVHQEALASLEFLLESEEGFAVIIGEPGTGKTITIRKFISQLPENVEYAYILFPNLSPEEMFRAVLEDFGIKIPDNATKNKLFSLLREFLIKKKNEGKKIFIVVDEAQNLPVETLEELRILSNLETEKEKLLQIILLGQPELEKKLNSPELRQLRQRITVLTHLRNLSKNEMIDYINYRLAKAGNSTIRISPSAYNLIYKYSEGNVRLINLIMERALMSAFVKNRHSVDKENIKEAVNSLNIEKKQRKIYPVVVAVFLVFLIAFGTSGYYLFSERIDSPNQIKKQEKKATVTANKLNVRILPDKNSDIVYVLSKGDELKILGEKDEWYRIKYKNVEGWVKKDFVRKSNEQK
ncbi:general secretion pathway protein A [Persephonella hydrogeniphila]|uniref:General secretion pathway protein A n=1 Tax=Persephonella hydrogeniphila TaxID=198703 RepID=A0A285MZ08_9AQUI|nr:AAA family ATPase [Persephonella hydrogeniphila]SNZ02424.1 general secretion pathway protein A [Persephonella hydrogeniphila]